MQDDVEKQIDTILQTLTAVTQVHQSGVHFDRLTVEERNRRIREDETEAKAELLRIVNEAIIDELKTLLKNVPMPTLSYEQVEFRIEQILTVESD